MEEPTIVQIVRELSGLPYLGPTRIGILRERGIDDVDGLRSLSDEELARIGYLGLVNARKLRSMLEGELPIPQPRVRRSADTGAAAGDEGAVAEARPRRRRGGQAEADAPVGEPVAQPARARRQRGAARAAKAAATGNGAVPAESAAAELEIPTIAVEAVAVPVETASPDGLDYDAALDARRGQLPATAMQLTEAIRSAAIARSLTRELARVLEAVDALSRCQAGLPDKQKRRAALMMNRAHGAIRRALEKRQFSRKQQRALADRLAKRTERLQRLVARAGASSNGV